MQFGHRGRILPRRSQSQGQFRMGSSRVLQFHHPLQMADRFGRVTLLEFRSGQQ